VSVSLRCFNRETDLVLDDLDAALDAFALHSPSCSGEHRIIDPLGQEHQPFAVLDGWCSAPDCYQPLWHPRSIDLGLCARHADETTSTLPTPASNEGEEAS
jgi:hypothetical protein